VTGKRGKDRKERKAVSIESQEIVTTMDPAVSHWSIVTVCVSGGDPLIVWLHGLL